MEKSNTCCFTGHRNILHKDFEALSGRLEHIIDELAESGVECFLTGGALGFDTLAAKTVLKLKQSNPKIQLGLILPCKNQTRGWSINDTKSYNEILRAADTVSFVSENYFRGCMMERNRRLVDGSSLCISYMTHGTGGTAYTVNYARKQGVKVINISK